jgi:hypothetical protein
LLLLGGGAVVWETLHTLILFFVGRFSTKLKLKKKKAGTAETGDEERGHHNHIEEFLSRIKSWKDGRAQKQKRPLAAASQPAEDPLSASAAQESSNLENVEEKNHSASAVPDQKGYFISEEEFAEPAALKGKISEPEIDLVIESLRGSGTKFSAKLLSSQKIDLRERIRFIHDELGFNIQIGHGRSLLGRRSDTLKAQKIFLFYLGLPLKVKNFRSSRITFIREELKEAANFSGWEGLSGEEKTAVACYFCEVYGMRSSWAARDKKWSSLLDYLGLPESGINYTARLIDFIQEYELFRYRKNLNLPQAVYRLSKIKTLMDFLDAGSARSLELYQGADGLELYRKKAKVGKDGQQSPITGAENPGGIDLRNLPITRQAVTNLSGEINPESLFHLENFNFSRELRDIYRLINTEISPSPERIKEFVQASCFKNEIDRDQDKIIRCIAEILRMDEGQCRATDLILRDILVVLESNRNAQDLRNVFFGMASRN